MYDPIALNLVFVRLCDYKIDKMTHYIDNAKMKYFFNYQKLIFVAKCYLPYLFIDEDVGQS